MNVHEKFEEIIEQLPSPRFQNPKLRGRLMVEVLDIHVEVTNSTRIKRKLKRRIKKAWSYGLPYDLFEQLKINSGLEARHIKMICEEE